MDEVLKDRLFYENSGGGMTVSGGEPTSQHEFTYALLRLAKDNGLHTCLETNGYAVFEKIKSLAQWVDIFLYDYKETNPKLHEKYTGVSNERILVNLKNLDDIGSEIILRCPIIPGLNDRLDHFAGIADLANQMHHILEIDIEPYHPLGIFKSHRLGKAPLFEAELFVPDEMVAKWVNDIQTKTNIPVKRL
jgi:pyruvate formate lyase activating enzyme